MCERAAVREAPLTGWRVLLSFQPALPETSGWEVSSGTIKWRGHLLGTCRQQVAVVAGRCMDLIEGMDRQLRKHPNGDYCAKSRKEKVLAFVPPAASCAMHGGILGQRFHIAK